MEIRKLCDYGCGSEAKHQLKNGKWCCSPKFVSCPEIRNKITKGQKRSYQNGRVSVFKQYGGWNKGLTKETDSRVNKGVETFLHRIAEGIITPSTKGTTLSEERKKQISSSMKRAHLEGRLKGWHSKNSDPNRRSYPEKFFIQLMSWHNFYERHIITEKKPFGKYFLDFAFENEHVDVEVDGNQHKRTQEAVKHDIERDSFVIEQGWRVYRIDWDVLQADPKEEIEKLKSFLQSDEIQGRSEKLTHEEFQQKQRALFTCPACGGVKKSKDSKICRSCLNKVSGAKRKVERPSKEELEKLMKELPMTKIGKQFGVSGNAVKKWYKSYGMC